MTKSVPIENATPIMDIVKVSWRCKNCQTQNTVKAVFGDLPCSNCGAVTVRFIATAMVRSGGID